MERTSCLECWKEVTVWEWDGFLCERCVPAKRPCENQGCAHTDIESKWWKHELYFCQQRTTCHICKVDVSRGTLSAHYGSEHQDITSNAGSTWRAIQGWKFHIVSSVAGTSVCEYDLGDTEFYLYVHIPVLGERLREFRCELQVIEPTTGYTQIYTPDVEYKAMDWRIKVTKEELPCWSGEFDVIVSINKIQ